MDPNEALRALRAALADFDTALDADDANQAAMRLYDAADALDGWLSKGGFPPQDWAPWPVPAP